MEKEKKEIELIPPKLQAPPTFFDQLLLWILKVAIPLVLLLQGMLIAISSARIALYTNLTVLSSSIEEKRQTLAPNLEFQDQILNTEKRISLITQNKKEALCFSCYIQDANQLALPHAFIQSLGINQNNLRISATSSDVISFAKFLEKALREEKITGIILTSSSRDRDGTYSFELTLTFAPRHLL